jgi:predicted ATPase with chaperone activity
MRSTRSHRNLVGLKVARTIADMSGQSQIEVVQIAEALALRTLDRQLAALNVECPTRQYR